MKTNYLQLFPLVMVLAAIYLFYLDKMFVANCYWVAGFLSWIGMYGFINRHDHD